VRPARPFVIEAAAAAVVGVAIAVGTVLPASALQLDRIEGKLPQAGVLVKFAAPHYKPNAGSVTADLTYVTTPTCGAPVMLGLRDSSRQFTKSAGWTRPGSLTFLHEDTNAPHLRGGITFWVNGRQLGTCSAIPVPDRGFKGGLWF
jgi:hypothetical protein